MIVSDTIFYRADGTVSTVQRVTRETFKTPSGREQSEDVTAEVPLSAISEHMAGPFAALDAHNRDLEALIERERGEAKATIADMSTTLASVTQARNDAVTRLNALADLDRQYDVAAAPLRLPQDEKPEA